MPVIVASQCVRGAQVIERRNSVPGWASTASNSCMENIRLLKLSPNSTLYRTVRYSFKKGVHISEYKWKLQNLSRQQFYLDMNT
jgi:hypothetical protein